jgi:hypothetical protein
VLIRKMLLESALLHTSQIILRLMDRGKNFNSFKVTSSLRTGQDGSYHANSLSLLEPLAEPAADIGSGNQS